MYAKGTLAAAGSAGAGSVLASSGVRALHLTPAGFVVALAAAGVVKLVPKRGSR